MNRRERMLATLRGQPVDRPQFNFIAVCLLCLCSLQAAAGEPAAPPAQVPEWAFGVLALRQFGPFFDKVGAYANQIVPNSADLAKQNLMAALFKLPVNAGLKNDAPVLLYILDPLNVVDMSDASALVLPVADPEKVKTALSTALGQPAENEGVLTFTLPQPLPQPDKTLLVKVASDRLFAAPNAAILKSLAEFAGQKPLAELGGTSAGDDALLTLKVARFKQRYGEILELCFAQGAAMASPGPQQGEKLAAQVKAALETLWQVDCLEAHFAIASGPPVSAELEFKIRPVAGSALAAALQKSPEAISGQTIALLPKDALLVLNINDFGYGKWVQDKISSLQPNANSQPIFYSSCEAHQALVELLKQINGDMAWSLTANDKGFTFFEIAEVNDLGKAMANVKSFLEKTTGMINAKMPSYGIANKITLKALPAEQYKEITIQAYKFEVSDIAPEDQVSLQQTIGWPLALHYAASGKYLLASYGKGSLATLKAAIDNSKNQLAPSDKADIPTDAFAWLEAHPTPLAQAALTLLAPETSGGITTGLPNAPITLSARIKENAASLRLTLPAEVPQALVMLWQRIERAHLQFALEQLLVGSHPAESVPAPLPLK